MKLKDGRILKIRRAVKDDAENLVIFLNSVGGESDFLTFGKDEANVTVEQEEQLIEFMNKGINQLFIIAEIDNELVGNLVFRGGNRPRNSHVGEFGISVRKEYWNLGIGRVMVQYLIRWAREGGIIRKINLRVREDNIAAFCLYENMGFEKEGILRRDFYYNGHFYSSIQMGLLID